MTLSTKWFSSPEDQQQKAEAETVLQNFLSRIGHNKLSVQWLDKQEAANFIQGYELKDDPLWPSLYDIPEKMKNAAEANGTKEALSTTLNDLPERLFHEVYDGAFHAFEQQGERMISHVVSAALYMTSLSATWDAVCKEPNPLVKLIEVLGLGYFPLGAKDGCLYVH